MSFILSQFIFYITIVFVLFVPGYFLLLASFGKSKTLHPIERLVISIGSSILLVDYLMLTMGKFGLDINRINLLAGILLISAIFFTIWKTRKENEETRETNLFNFSKNQTILIILLLFSTILLKTIYLKDNILPAATDLGHHMYWVNTIVESGKIPNYTKQDIVQSDGHYAISAPMNISDFIIGEHLIFAAISILSGISVVSYFPVLIFFLVDIFTVLAIFILTLRLFSHHPKAQNIGIISLLIIGPIFAILPPQAKFVAGGVSGNIIGNLLLPIALYFFYRFFTEKKINFVILALFVSMGIFYTHHLTGLLFLLMMVLTMVFLFITEFKETIQTLTLFTRPRFFLPVIFFFVFAGIVLLFIYTPTYITNEAVNTVVGAPAKVEHTGLTFNQFKDAVGEPRLALGIIGILFLIFTAKNNRKQAIILISWMLILISITFWPNYIRLSIPSGRVANYASYPLAIITSFALIQIFYFLFSNNSAKKVLNKNLILGGFIILFLFIFSGGLVDNFQNLPKTNNYQKAVETFHASRYLASKASSQDNILSDHVYLTADSWIKLFLMRDYNFPFYRANLERYENNVDKTEFCTLWGIGSPDSADSQKCYNELHIKYVMVNIIDTPQFERSQNFSKVYQNEDVAIFLRKN